MTSAVLERSTAVAAPVAVAYDDAWVQAYERPATRERAAAPVRLTPRGRRLLRTLAVLVLVLLGVLGVIAGQSAVAGQGPAPTHRVVVGPGESLWSVATRALPDLDAREAVAQVAALNHLDESARLTVGQALELPGD